MPRNAPESGSAEIRRILATAERSLTIDEIFVRCARVRSTARVAGQMLEEVRAGRAIRTGTPGTLVGKRTGGEPVRAGGYRYAITAHGRACQANPRLLHRTDRRRPHTRRRPLDLRALTAAIEDAAPDTEDLAA